MLLDLRRSQGGFGFQVFKEIQDFPSQLCREGRPWRKSKCHKFLFNVLCYLLIRQSLA